MKNELKQAFTLRLSQCNKGEMIVILYDIFFAYLDEAREAHAGGDHAGYKEGIRRANATLERLIGDLDHKYELSHNLHHLYIYCRNELSKALYENKTDRIDGAEQIMRRLYTSFVEVARQDTSAPLMCNTQKVYAGITYGRMSINENLMDQTASRGFYA